MAKRDLDGGEGLDAGRFVAAVNAEKGPPSALEAERFDRPRDRIDDPCVRDAALGINGQLAHTIDLSCAMS